MGILEMTWRDELSQIHTPIPTLSRQKKETKKKLLARSTPAAPPSHSSPGRLRPPPVAAPAVGPFYLSLARLELPAGPFFPPLPDQSLPTATYACGRPLPLGLSLPSPLPACDGGSLHPDQHSPVAFPRRPLCLPPEGAVMVLPFACPSPACATSYGRRRVKNVFCKPMFQMFHRHVTNVSYGCCICCNGCICIF
jgi:hypothetical protein